MPAFRPALGRTEQHFFYVLWDDLDLLHDLLSNGIERAGQWKTVAGTPLAERLGSRSIAPPEIPLRLDLLEVFCQLWNQGRGRPVGHDALEDSGVLTERYLRDVVAHGTGTRWRCGEACRCSRGEQEPASARFSEQQASRGSSVI